uniref:GATA-type domain-containing protein n=1 Tax=Meloidogyne hapla TaxID=6305 RepID=A0A1I8BYV4_MELHA
MPPTFYQYSPQLSLPKTAISRIEAPIIDRRSIIRRKVPGPILLGLSALQIIVGLVTLLIGTITERKKRHCFNCKVTKTVKWHKYLNNYYLCNPCGKKQKANVQNMSENIKCFNCGVTQTTIWRRHSENKQYLCDSCGYKQRGYNTKRRINKGLKKYCIKK